MHEIDLAAKTPACPGGHIESPRGHHQSSGPADYGGRTRWASLASWAWLWPYTKWGDPQSRSLRREIIAESGWPSAPWPAAA